VNSPSRQQEKRKQYTLRLSESISEKLENRSKKIGLSKNAIITMILAEALDVGKGEDNAPVAGRANRSGESR